MLNRKLSPDRTKASSFSRSSAKPLGVGVTGYKRLISDITELYEGARKALVEAYWKIGQRIVEVEQQGAVKAVYGTGLISRLSEDLTKQCGPGFSPDNLQRMRRFYLTYPKNAAPRKLAWSQYAELLPLEDVRTRERLEKCALKESLSHKVLRTLVRHELVREQVEENLAAAPEEKKPLELLIPPKDLRLHTYKKGDALGTPSQTGYVVDCGFYVYREVTRAQYENVTITDKPAYAYEATVERVIDGDTIWVVIDVGFGTQVREKLRLRGLDCPELGSEEGEAAKRFVTKLLSVGAKILLKTTRSEDKYGRYVADVMLNDEEGKQIYLNNLLLEKGYAVRVYE